jgi:cytochrome c oxidase assembly factor 5
MPSCKGLRQEVVDCILTSDCVLRDKRSLKDCLSTDANDDSVPDKCRQLQRAHMICVRGMVY